MHRETAANGALSLQAEHAVEACLRKRWTHRGPCEERLEVRDGGLTARLEA